MRWRLAGLLLFLVTSHCLAQPGAVGDRYEILEGKEQTYQRVQVREITPQGLIIFHKGGISQVPFSDLPQTIREKYGYSAAEEAAYLEERQARESKAAIAKPTRTPDAPETASILDQFGTTPTLYAALDMRRAFNSMNLPVKDQGRRPSCAVFAVVSALEFENAKVADQPQKLSEEYLIWATRETLGIPGEGDPNYDPNRDGDLGFTLTEVVQAVRRYGIPEAADMPNTFGKSMARIRPPKADTIEKARARRKLTSTYVTGRGNAERIQNLLHALNAGVPVVVGVLWPHEATLRSAPLLSKQSPQYGHAVTLVGYKSDTGKVEDTLFLFKNSWGPGWGINGHGWITYEYLEKNLQSAVVLEVQ